MSTINNELLERTEKSVHKMFDSCHMICYYTSQTASLTAPCEMPCVGVVRSGLLYHFHNNNYFTITVVRYLVYDGKSCVYSVDVKIRQRCEKSTALKVLAFCVCKLNVTYCACYY